MVTKDPLPLIRNLLDAGADPIALVNNTPRARVRAGSPPNNAVIMHEEAVALMAADEGEGNGITGGLEVEDQE